MSPVAIVTTPPRRRDVPPRERDAAGEAGARIVCDDVSVTARDGTLLLDSISITVEPGELVAIVGPSGAGKTTLLDVLAGLVQPTSGNVAMLDELGAPISSAGGDVAYVPQDDVIHRELTLRRVLHHAARLRLPVHAGRGDVDRAVTDALAAVDLETSADRLVAELSGGQRRRASIALELVTHPRVCFLDEPTSGLDASAASTVVERLRTLADAGSTVVFVTHRDADLELCDRVIELLPGGRLRATRHAAPDPDIDGRRPEAAAADRPRPALARSSAVRRWLRQSAVLTARTVEVMVRTRLTLAILLGSPAMVIAMFAVLFRPGAFDAGAESPAAVVMIVFWIAFGGFFFGLTYGLLQVCPELPIIRRERARGVALSAQLLAKVAALAPVLLLIDAAMLGVLRLLDRLPAADAGAYGRLLATLALDSIAALALGLLASAAVSTAAQAALALPMLCFPAVLFSGAVVPVPVMATAGRWISALMTDRWAFEAIGRDLGVRQRFEAAPSALGRPLLAEYGDTWTRSTAAIWVLLAAATAALLLAAGELLRRRCRRPARTS